MLQFFGGSIGVVKDTEALVTEGHVPQVDAKIVRREESLLIAVHRQ